MTTGRPGPGRSRQRQVLRSRSAVTFGGLSGSSPIKALAVSPGGKVAVGTAAGNVLFWDQADVKTLKGTLSGHTGGVSALAISADSRILVAVGGADKIVRAWDLTAQPAPLELQRLAHLAAGANGLAVSGGTTTGSAPFVMEAGSTDKALMKLPLAASGAFVTESGADVGALAADDSAVHAGLTSGKVLSYAAADGTGPTTISLKNAKPVIGLATATDAASKRLLFAICTGETTLQGGKVEDGTLGVVLDSLPAPPKALSVDRSGRIAALGFDTTNPVTLYDLDSTTMPKASLALLGSASVTALALLPDGRLVATSRGVSKAGLWRAIGPRPEFVTAIGNGGFGVFASAWMPAGASVVLAGNKSKIQLWNLGTNTLSPIETTSTVELVLALATSSDGLIASGHKDKSVKLWDSSLAKKAEVVAAHDDRVTALAFKDSKLLASGSASGQVRLWEINAAAASITKKGAQDSAHATVVKSVAFSPDGQKLATLGFDGILILWDVSDPANPKEIIRLSPPPTYQGQQVDWSPDGTMLVVGASDKQAHLIQFSP